MTGVQRTGRLNAGALEAPAWTIGNEPSARRGMLSRAIADIRSWPWAKILFLHVVYVAANFSLDLIPYPSDTTLTADMLVAGSETGMLGRRIGFIVLALVAIVALARRGRSALRIKGVLGVLMLAYFALAAASYFWADDPSLVLRKLIVMGCVWLGALWAAVFLGPRGILAFAFASSVLTTITAIAIEIAAGRFRPFIGGFRLAGMQQPNDLAQCVAIGITAAIALAGEAGGMALFFGAAAVAGTVALAMTGSRTSLFAAVTAVGVYFAILATRRRAAAWLMLTGIAAAVLGFCTLTVAGYNVPSVVVDLISLGRSDSDLKSLTMRTPLWHELITRYISARPFSGYGYASFWTEAHIRQMSIGMHGFAYKHSHSGYIEMALSIGLIGTALHVFTILLSAFREGRAYVATNQSARAFGAAILAALLVGMFGEPLNIAVALMPTFVAMAVMAGAAFVVDDRTP